MAYQISTSSIVDEESSIRVLGETGGTIVHVFPNGKAKVKKGTREISISQTHPSAQRQGRSTHVFSTNDTLEPKGDTPPPPPPLRPGCLAFEPTTVANKPNSTADKLPKTRKELERYLLDRKIVSPVQLDVARYDMSMSSMSLEEILVARGWVTPDIIVQFQNS